MTAREMAYDDLLDALNNYFPTYDVTLGRAINNSVIAFLAYHKEAVWKAAQPMRMAGARLPELTIYLPNKFFRPEEAEGAKFLGMNVVVSHVPFPVIGRAVEL